MCPAHRATHRGRDCSRLVLPPRGNDGALRDEEKIHSPEAINSLAGPRANEARLYHERVAALATMHGKQAVIAPPMREVLGLDIVVPDGIDTDSLGTFTGEIARTGTMLETAVAKARLGMSSAGLTLGLASEGSYGPDPLMPFLPVGVEILVFVDDDLGIAIHETLSYPTASFGQIVVDRFEDISAFLERVGFPDLGLVVRPHHPANDRLTQAETDAKALGEERAPIALTQMPALSKGIRTHQDLAKAVAAAALYSADGRVLVQTDMRAHMNPKRLSAISELAERLARRIATLCPRCRCPGFGMTGAQKGLPCELCATPTSQIKIELFGCQGCGYAERHTRSDGVAAADPTWCPLCNP